MSWLGIWHRVTQVFDPEGIDPLARQGSLLSQVSDALLPTGSLVIELTVPEGVENEPLLHFQENGDWPTELAIWRDDANELVMQIVQYGASHSVSFPKLPGQDTAGVRLTISWDAPRFEGRIALEAIGSSTKPVLKFIAAPKPWRLKDLEALLQSAPNCFVSPSVKLIALADKMEPVGPMPSLDPMTPIETPTGYRQVSQIKRGDLVCTASGDQVPVLHVVQRQVPAFESFAPIRLQAPYFGLEQDLLVAPYQHILLAGTDVDYLFGSEAVRASAKVLARTRGGSLARRSAPLVTYAQLVLPTLDVPIAAGLGLESLNLGRLRRDPDLMAASLLHSEDRSTLPEHAALQYPQLRAFDAAVLADRRIA